MKTKELNKRGKGNKNKGGATHTDTHTIYIRVTHTNTTSSLETYLEKKVKPELNRRKT